MKYIGIDIGGMSIKGGVVTENGEILEKTVIETQIYDEKHPITDDLALIINRLLEKHPLVAGVGIGSPGAIDPEAGVIKYSNNVKLENVPVKEILEKKFPFPAFIDNDANCAALGEAKFGAGGGLSDVIFITLGTGVGSGIIVGGKLFTGYKGGGAEAGHTVIIAGGEPCTCGRRGCWEQYASATALIRQTKAAMEENPASLMHGFAEAEGKISGKTSFKAAAAGDGAAKAVVSNYLGYIAEGLLNLANVFRPQLVIIGGGVSHEGQALLKPLQEELDAKLFGGKYNPRVKVSIASLGNDAGLLGAAALAM